MTIDAQGSLFGDGRMAAPTRPSTPDPEAVRGRLRRLLETLRGAQTMPLSEKDLRMWQTLVPTMTRWLPDDEADAIRSEFASETKRLCG